MIQEDRLCDYILRYYIQYCYLITTTPLIYQSAQDAGMPNLTKELCS